MDDMHACARKISYDEKIYVDCLCLLTRSPHSNGYLNARDTHGEFVRGGEFTVAAHRNITFYTQGGKISVVVVRIT